MTCQCFLHYRLYKQTPAVNKDNLRGASWHIWGLIFNKLAPKDLLSASQVCKIWRFVAAKYCIDPLADSVRGISCSNVWKDFRASRHIFLFDVSGSMNASRMQNARQIYDSITDFLAPIIMRKGLFVCKFARDHQLAFFRTKDGAEEFLNVDSEINRGATDLNSAVQTVYDKVLALRKIDTHIYVISDMLLKLDDTIFDKKMLDKVSKVTFHFYNADENADGAFLKDIEDAFAKKNGTVSKHLGMRFYRETNVVKTGSQHDA